MEKNVKENQNTEPLYLYQFTDASGFIFQIAAHSYTEAAKIAREQCAA